MPSTTLAEAAVKLSPRRFARRTAVGITSLAAILAVGLIGWSVIARHSLAIAHPPRGQLVDIGGYKLHLNCMGEGTGPTVILEAGNADFSVMWAKVQPEVAEWARVCAYDRAGLGWSERGPAPRSIAAMTDEMHRLLDAAGIDGKLLLVGHSFGGIVVRNFAAAHPERVAGLVLIDPAHERQLELVPEMQEAVTSGVAQFESLVPLATWGVLAMLPQNIPNRGLPEEAHWDYAATLATTEYFSVASEETKFLETNLQDMAKLPRDLGSLPLTIVSRGLAEPASGAPADRSLLDEAWEGLQIDLAKLSSNSRHIVVSGAGHYVQLDRPDVVIEEIQIMLERL